MKKQKRKYKITYSTLPSNQKHTDEEVNKMVSKAINLIIDELILNEHIKVGNC
jgi:hypothetical protein